MFIFVFEHCLVLLTLLPTNTKISHECLDFRVAKLEGIQPPEAKGFVFHSNNWQKHYICMNHNKNHENLVKLEEIDFKIMRKTNKV